MEDSKNVEDMSYEELREIEKLQENISIPNSRYNQAKRRREALDSQKLEKISVVSNKIAIGALIVSILSLIISIFK